MAAKPRLRVGTNGGYAMGGNASNVTGAVVDGKVLRPGASYMKGNRSPFFFNWNPALREQREDVQIGYVEAAARAIDAIHNSGWLAGAVDQSIASTIGTGLRLAARPDREALGWTADQAAKWSETVERRWTTYSERALECDVAGKSNVAAQQDSVLRHTFNFGEALALLPFVKRPFNLNGTKAQQLPPTRLVQDNNITDRLSQGIRTDIYGLPLSYRIKIKADDFRGVDVRARDGIGRPQVAHIFEGQPGQMRGITPLAASLRTVKQYDQLSDATLQTALIQTIFSATLEGSAPTEEILRALQSEDEQAETQGVDVGGIEGLIAARAAWYDNTKIDLGGASKVVHLFPGEKLTFNRNEHPNSNYESFAKFLLREIARCLGMTFETLTGDYSGATYSSVRMATSEIWPIILRRRGIVAAYTQMLYEAWLEEEIEQGHIPFTNGIFGFMAMRAAASLANWRGPAKPQADDLKTAKAHEIYKNMGIMSDERIADDLGYDIGDEYERRAREMEQRKKLGLPEHKTMEPDPAVEALINEKEPA
jgi:lambda family phage portal protein